MYFNVGKDQESVEIVEVIADQQSGGKWLKGSLNGNVAGGGKSSTMICIPA